MLRHALCVLSLASVIGCGFKNPYSGSVAEAYVTFGRGDTKAALKQLDQIIRKQPTPAAYQLRATIRITSRDFRGAVVDATNGLKLDPKNQILRGLKVQAENLEETVRQAEKFRPAPVQFGGASGLRMPGDKSW